MYDIIYKLNKKHGNIVLFILGFSSTLIGYLFSRGVENLCVGYLSITITLIPLIQVFSYLIEKEELKEERMSRKNVLTRHWDFIRKYFATFFGIVFGYYFTYIITPPDQRYLFFYLQIEAIREIYRTVSVSAVLTDKQIFFLSILRNNINVLILSFITSFIFGVGAIYLMTWNASIVGVFLGMSAESIKTNNLIYKYVLFPLLKFLKLMPHGFFEFLSFFLAGLSGALIALGLVKRHTKHFNIILEDAFKLLLYSIILLILAAAIEAR